MKILDPYIGWVGIWEHGYVMTSICQKRRIAEQWAKRETVRMFESSERPGKFILVKVVIQDARTVSKKIINACEKLDLENVRDM